MRAATTLRIAAGAMAWVIVGCGSALPEAEEATGSIGVAAAPIPADPYDEVVYPEPPPAAEEPAPAAPPAAADEPYGAPAETFVDPNLAKALDAAERKASDEGRLVLETGRRMALVDREVILGACWDYANTVYKRAGFPANKRRTVYNKPKTGPYADPDLFRPGDFLSYSHDEKGEWVHSAIFVDWTNAAERVALMLTYPGGKRPVPAYYSDYVLTHVFRVVRPKP